MMDDTATIENIHDAVDGYQTEVIMGLVDLGLSQNPGSVGAAGAVVNAPSRLATPMFNPGQVHKLQPMQIPRTAISAQPGLGSNIASALATLAITALLEAIGRATGEDVETEERRKTEFCRELGFLVCSRLKARLTDESQRGAIFTQDKVKRFPRNRKSNRN